MNGSRPSFSIVIPTYQRPARLASCLEAVRGLDYPVDRFEVVVVDDGTRPEGSVESVIHPHRTALELKLIRQSNAGPAAARNAGADQAAREFLAFTDDDCRPRPDWLEALAERFAASPDAVVGGLAVNALTADLCAAASQILVDFVRDYFRNRGAPIFPSNNLALRREVFRRLGGFDRRFPLAAGEDREFCDRAKAEGLELIQAPAAVVDHFHALTLSGFWRQHYNYGRGAWRFHRARADRGSGRVRLEPFRFYRDLICAPFRREPRRRPWPIAALLVLSQLANAAGFYRERFRRRRGRGRRETHDPA